MTRLLLILLLPLLILASACGDKKGYRIECQIEGLGDRGIEAIVTDGSNLGRIQVHPDKKGRLVIEGDAPRPLFVELFPMDGGVPIASLIAADGDRIQLAIDPDAGPASLRITGNSQSMNEYGAWLAGADSLLRISDDDRANRLITDFVDTHRDSPAAALAVATLYRTRGNELRADSVFNLIAPAARGPWSTAIFGSALGRRTIDTDHSPRSFSLPIAVGTDRFFYSPYSQRYSLLIFNDAPKPPAILDIIKSLHNDFKDRHKALRIIEIGFETDSATWRAHLGPDTALWSQAWVPGGPATSQVANFAVPTAPYYILADSTGHVLYRGPHILPADTLVRHLLDTPADTTATRASSEAKPTPAASSEAAPKAVPKAPSAEDKARGPLKQITTTPTNPDAIKTRPTR